VLDFCRHYDVSMLPARPYAPQDKAKVESAVQVVERWILARLRHERLADEKMQSKPLARPRIPPRDRSIREKGVNSSLTVNLTVKILGSTAREDLPSLEFPA
jgi:transposase